MKHQAKKINPTSLLRCFVTTRNTFSQFISSCRFCYFVRHKYLSFANKVIAQIHRNTRCKDTTEIVFIPIITLSVQIRYNGTYSIVNYHDLVHALIKEIDCMSQVVSLLFCPTNIPQFHNTYPIWQTWINTPLV